MIPLLAGIRVAARVALAAPTPPIMTGNRREARDDMSMIVRYARWPQHDAGGTLPAEDVLAGVLADGAWIMPASWPPLAPDEALVYIPPQWIGDWQTGHRLAPGYQHVWRVPRAALRPLPRRPRFGPYRPATLPDSAIGPLPRRIRWRDR